MPAFFLKYSLFTQLFWTWAQRWTRLHRPSPAQTLRSRVQRGPDPRRSSRPPARPWDPEKTARPVRSCSSCRRSRILRPDPLPSWEKTPASRSSTGQTNTTRSRFWWSESLSVRPTGANLNLFTWCFPLGCLATWTRGFFPPFVSLVSTEKFDSFWSSSAPFGLCVNQLFHKNISSRCSCVLSLIDQSTLSTRRCNRRITDDSYQYDSLIQWTCYIIISHIYDMIEQVWTKKMKCFLKE